MKLDEIKDNLTRGDCSPELLTAFKTALRRAPKTQRAQHCYTTAAAMPACRFPQAVELIEYSLTLEGSWLDRMRAYANLADLYEKRGDYVNALDNHQKSLAAVESDKRDAYAADSAARMLVCQLHLDDFTYSEELHRLYNQSLKLDNFSRSFQKCLFYMSLAEILLFQHDGDLPAAQAAHKKASAMLQPGYQGPLTALLKRKNYMESTGATKEARAFLKRAAQSL